MKKKILGALSLGVLALTLSSCGEVVAYPCNPIYVFDTGVSIVFYDEPEYQDYYKVIKSKLNDIDRAADDFESNEYNNSIYDLNDKRSVESELLADMVSKAVELSGETDGYFNPFIGRLTHLWKTAINNDSVLDATTVSSELEIMNNTSVTVEGNTITLVGEGNLDLGAMTKGYAVDWIKNYLEENNVSKYYINCGASSIYVGDIEENIALSKPFSSDCICEFKSSNIGIGTSSPKFQNTVIDGVRYHHLINPFTGYPSNIYDSVNIISTNNMKNDVFSTAIFSMDLDTAKAFADKEDINIVLFKDDSIVYQRKDL